MDSAAFIVVLHITLLKYARGQENVTYSRSEGSGFNFAAEDLEWNGLILAPLQKLGSTWIIYPVACGILALLIVSGNLIVVIVFSKSKKLRNPHSAYKISIAVSDLLFGTAILPLLIVSFTSRLIPVWIPLVLTFTTAWISIVSLMFMGLNSMFAVSLPLKYKQYRKRIRKVNMIFVISIWISACSTVGLFPAFPVIAITVCGGGCLMVWFDNVVIFVIVILKSRKIKTHRSSGISNSLGKEKTIAITLTIMSLAFTITTLPYLIMFSFPIDFMMIDEALLYSLFYVAFTSGLWNCLIYNFRNKDFRDEAKKLFRRGWPNWLEIN